MEKLYTTREISIEYGISEGWLRKLRHMRKGPKYHKLGRAIRYRQSDVKTWLEQAIVTVEPDGLV